MKRTAGAVVFGYALGAVPAADVVARIAGPDAGNLREIGSHNPGAMNVGKELGSRWGALVSVLDVGKGVIAAHLGRRLAGPLGANLASTAAVAGHCYPFGRTGGKGVATSVGQVIGTFPKYLPIDAGVAMATAVAPVWRQRTFVATGVSSAVWVTAALTAWRRGWATGTDDPAPASLPVAAALTSGLIARRFLETPLADGRPR